MPEPIDVINQYTGEKWYYSDQVKDHFFNPRNLLLDDPKEGEYNAMGLVGSPACVDPATLIQTNPASKRIDEVSKKEKVLGHDGYFHSVERIFKPRYASEVIKIKNQLGTLSASPDHLIFAIQIPRTKSKFFHTYRKKKLPISWVHAGDLKKGDIVLYPIPQEVREMKEIVLPEFVKKVWDFKSKSLPSRIPIQKDLLELFGYFVAEGHTRDSGKEAGFTFSINEKIFAERVRFLARKYFHVESVIRERRESNRIDVAIYSVQLSRLFREWFGSGAAEKRAPGWLMFLSPELQAGFIRGIWRGDGYFNAIRSQPRAGFATISRTLIHQMRWLLLRQKIAPSFYRGQASIKKGVSHKASYRIHIGGMNSLERLAAILEIPFSRDVSKQHAEEVWFDEEYMYLPIRNCTIGTFSGRLANFEVAESHSYTTDAFLVHNCGDMMHIWMKINPESERVTDLKWRTFGCGSAIAATSMFSVMVTESGGRTLEEARGIKPQHIMERLGGLPNRKIHCSVLVDKAFQKAANDYFRKIGKYEKIVVEGAKVIDAGTQTTDKDIEEAVLEGAVDLDAVQKKLKVGIGNPEIIPEVEQLIRFYKEKYYG
ncbi:MAG: iron-sulfur cluster assembly scaffold protein [Candidatus Sungbacteria bacterium]|uniref:Iron-sulfur cluster assembly scaffold protein n=1 Tax=Candidatus Sungiibacteriota bacterium TaxID=2750080 RepID=A0A9D6QV94_9BACT|nr:iron-sulfur cluster assembly scaffold protein [Candidatus Sungbacteria bacterium]